MISDSKKQKPTSADTTGEPAIAVAVSNHESPITNHNLSNHTANTDDDTTVIKIRGLTNRFGSQTVHDGLTLTCGAVKSSVWSAARAPASRC